MLIHISSTGHPTYYVPWDHDPGCFLPINLQISTSHTAHKRSSEIKVGKFGNCVPRVVASDISTDGHMRCSLCLSGTSDNASIVRDPPAARDSLLSPRVPLEGAMKPQVAELKLSEPSPSRILCDCVCS